MDCTSQRLSYRSTAAFSNIVLDYLDDAAALKPFYVHRPNLEGIKQAISQRSAFKTNRRALVKYVATVDTASANVVINPQPATPSAPTVGTITQPTCTVATGSVVLNGLPSSGTWTINPGGITGTGTSTTITGLASGFYFLELNNNSAKQIKKIIVN